MTLSCVTRASPVKAAAPSGSRNAALPGVCPGMCTAISRPGTSSCSLSAKWRVPVTPRVPAAPLGGQLGIGAVYPDSRAALLLYAAGQPQVIEVSVGDEHRGYVGD